MISQADIQALKDYVKGPSSQNQAESTVRMQVTHSNLKAQFMELRLDLHVSKSLVVLQNRSVSQVQHICAMQMTIGAVKHKLMSHTGSSPSSMQLQLKDESGNLLDHLSDDSRLLGFYSPYNG